MAISPNDYKIDFARLENNRWQRHFETCKTRQKCLGRLMELLDDKYVGKVIISRLVGAYELKTKAFEGIAYSEYKKHAKAYETLCGAYQLASEKEREKFMRLFRLTSNNSAVLPYLMEYSDNIVDERTGQIALKNATIEMEMVINELGSKTESQSKPDEQNDNTGSDTNRSETNLDGNDGNENEV